MTIKFNKFNITDGKIKARVHYSLGQIIGDSRDCITIYAKDFNNSLQQIFKNAQNDSNLIIDYFEKSRVRIFNDNPIYQQILKFAKK